MQVSSVGILRRGEGTADVAPVILQEAAQVAACLDEIDAEAEDAGLQGEREPEVWPLVSYLLGDAVQARLAAVWICYRGGDGFERLIQLT